MSSETLPASDAAARGVGRERGATVPRWRDLTAAEWLKLRSLRSNFVVLATAVGIAFFAAYASAKQTATAYPGADNWMVGTLQPAHDAFFPPGFFTVMTIVGTVGAQAVVAEHASGLIRTTFIAVPGRSRVMLAKAAVVAGVLTVVGLITAAGCWQITLTEYSSRITGYGWHSPGTATMFGATVLAFPLAGLVGMAIGTLIRHTAVSIFAMVVNFWVMPVGISSLDDVQNTHIFGHISNVLPENGWLFLTTMGNTEHIVGGHPSAAEGWISYAAWAVAAVLVIALVPRRQDV
jgi:ABC-2 type transport system permease protein